VFLLALGSSLCAYTQDKPVEIDVVADSLAVNDSIPIKQPLLLDLIKRNAKGYVSIDKANETMTLYDEAELYYQDVELKSGIIELDYSTNIVTAGRIKDSTGQLVQYPSFKQGGDEVFPDSLRFNFDTKKAIIWNSRSEQGGMNVKAMATKKENDSVYYIRNARVTTSENVDDPEYYIRVRTGKFVPKKKIIAGLSNLYIADVPTPLFLPFAYFPMTQTRESGFIFPTIGENYNRGYFMQNGGYYFAVSDYFDLSVLGDYYTNGSFGFRLDSNYNKRYKYRGSLGFRFENLINGERGLPGYSKNTIFNLRWSHSKDAKSNPNSRFSASVNIGSSTYFQQSLNQINTGNFLNNTLSSSVSYSKTFPKYPSVNLSISASHSQNTRTEIINMTLPTFQASMERIYPFAKRDGIKKGILQNINFQYSVRGENRIQTNDDDFLTGRMFDDARNGFRHQIPISTSFKVAKHFNFSVGGSYNEVWAFETIKKNDYDPILDQEVAQDTISGFDRYAQYNFSASMGTTLYGVFNFKEDAKVESIRHVINANVGYSRSPSFEQYYDEYVIDAEGNTRSYSRFDGGLYGSPSRNKSSSLSFTLRNSVEAKVKDRDSTAVEPKKIKLLNNLNFSTSYNIEADSLRWSPVRMSAVIPFLDNKLNVNIGATFDPYAINENFQRINTYNIDTGGPLFRMTSANFNWGYKFSNKNKKKNSDNQEDDTTQRSESENDLFGGSQDFSDRRFTANESRTQNQNEDDESEFYKTNIPWNLNLRHSLTYANSRRNRDISNNSLMVSADVGLTPKWDVGVSTGYDFKNKGITYTNFRIERDLDSWVMNLAWTPFGDRQSWFFFIGVRSGMLSDLKYDKRRERDRRL
jgi:hypothetical protein